MLAAVAAGLVVVSAGADRFASSRADDAAADVEAMLAATLEPADPHVLLLEASAGRFPDRSLRARLDEKGGRLTAMAVEEEQARVRFAVAYWWEERCLEVVLDGTAVRLHACP